MAEIPVESLIREAATSRGVDPDLAVRIAQKESSLYPKAKNPRSSAYGLFQITNDTWKEYGGTPENRYDMMDNIRIGMDIIASNRDTFLKKFGRAPNAGELYTMHMMGKTGGPRLMSQDPNALMADVVSPKIIKANRIPSTQTVGEFIASMQQKMGSKLDTMMAKRGTTEQKAGTVPTPKAPKETIKERPVREPIIPLAEGEMRKRPLPDQRLSPLAQGEMSQDMIASLGPNYQAALGAMALGDTSDDDIDYDDDEALGDRYQRYVAEQDRIRLREMEDAQEESRPTALASLDLSYQSPFEQSPFEQSPFEEEQPQAPVMLARGGVVHRRDGSPMYGEMVPDSGPVTEDTRKALSTRQGLSAAELMRMFKGVGSEVVSNLETIGRGAKAAVPGFFGDTQKEFVEDVEGRKAIAKALDLQLPSPRGVTPSKKPEPRRFLATTEEVERDYLPGRVTKPTAQAPGFFQLGTLIDPGLALGFAGSAREALAQFRKAKPAPMTFEERMAARDQDLRINQSIIDQRVAQGNAAIPTLPARRTRATLGPAQPAFAPAENAMLPPLPDEIVLNVEGLGPIPASRPLSRGSDNLMQEQPRTDLLTPFVSRLDQFVQQQKNPMTKQQFLGSLKGKFRDYEILRAEEALAGLNANDKITPAQISERLSTVYPVNTLQRNVFPPRRADERDGGGLYSGSDNVYTEQNFNKPMGVVTLNLPMTESAREAEKLASNLADIREKLSIAKLSNKDKKQLLSFAESPEQRQMYESAIKASNEFVEARDTLKRLEKMYMNPYEQGQEWNDAFKAAMSKDLEKNPQLEFTEGWYRDNADRFTLEANQAIWKKADEEMRRLGFDPVDRSDSVFSDPTRLDDVPGQMFRQMREGLQPLQDKIFDAGYSEEFTNTLRSLDERIENMTPYPGQHESVTKGTKVPVAFSRYTDHIVNIPGFGETKVMNFSELQSDMLDDIIKKGGKSGNLAKDQNEIAEVEDKMYKFATEKLGKDDGRYVVDQLQGAFMEYEPAIRQEKIDALRKQMGPAADKIITELLPQVNRFKKLDDRMARGATYATPEAFAGMEKAPQVAQQLMIKNAIGAAIDRGMGAVTFPGKESKQAQLYEKVERNIDQVLKDLGPGFTKVPITIEKDYVIEKAGKLVSVPTTEKDEVFTHWGVIWDPEAAKRTQKEGIRFNKGGMVEKSDYDNRRYI